MSDKTMDGVRVVHDGGENQGPEPVADTDAAMTDMSSRANSSLPGESLLSSLPHIQ
jgi:hypothetical protein